MLKFSNLLCFNLYYKERVILKTRFTKNSTSLSLTGGPTCHKRPTKSVVPDDERGVSMLENTFGDFVFLFSPGRSLPAPCTHIFILEGVVALFTPSCTHLFILEGLIYFHQIPTFHFLLD
jgi:hypothetical protein